VPIAESLDQVQSQPRTLRVGRVEGLDALGLYRLVAALSPVGHDQSVVLARMANLPSDLPSVFAGLPRIRQSVFHYVLQPTLLNQDLSVIQRDCIERYTSGCQYRFHERKNLPDRFGEIEPFELLAIPEDLQNSAHLHLE